MLADSDQRNQSRGFWIFLFERPMERLSMKAPLEIDEFLFVIISLEMSRYYQAEEKDYEKYSNPRMPTSKHSIITYENNLKSVMDSNENVNLHGVPNMEDYPQRASYSRFPVKIRCTSCNELTMTDVEYENGFASKIWCFLLMPFFCTGCCCLCLNSCKDVKHICSKCRKDAGTCKSQCCWFTYFDIFSFALHFNAATLCLLYFVSLLLTFPGRRKTS